MSNGETIDVAALRAWIGREETASDAITPGLVQRLLATLDREPVLRPPGTIAPPMIHWCLAPATASMSGLGPDGHPARGGFLPPVPLPRRMWAGGSLVYHDTLRVGDAVERTSRIADVTLKEGRGGVLCFVTVEHQASTVRGLAIVERQDIVYRDMDRPAATAPALPPAQPAPASPILQWTIQADPVLLFRYSALTFNGHRIHYDRRYCVEVENYPGLVVHGPLQATILMELAVAAKGGLMPRRFDFRGLSPLFDGGPFQANARHADDGIELWISDSEGRKTMTAAVTW
jgi:3-methylfumaryl-CoA hydratase